MQLSVIYRFERSMLPPADRPAVGLGPIVKRETDVVLVDASAAVPAGGYWLGPPPPSFASRSVRFGSIRNALSPCHE
jgi:hypothetical protein